MATAAKHPKTSIKSIVVGRPCNLFMETLPSDNWANTPSAEDTYRRSRCWIENFGRLLPRFEASNVGKSIPHRARFTKSTRGPRRGCSHRCGSVPACDTWTGGGDDGERRQGALGRRLRRKAGRSRELVPAAPRPIAPVS